MNRTSNNKHSSMLHNKWLIMNRYFAADPAHVFHIVVHYFSIFIQFVLHLLNSQPSLLSSVHSSENDG